MICSSCKWWWWLKSRRAWSGSLTKHRPESPSETNTCIQKKALKSCSTRDARQIPTPARIASGHRAEDEDGDDEERVYLTEAESVFSITSASERLPRAAAAGQRVKSVMSVQPIRAWRPRSVTLHHQHQSRTHAAAGLAVPAPLSRSQLQQHSESSSVHHNYREHHINGLCYGCFYFIN